MDTSARLRKDFGKGSRERSQRTRARARVSARKYACTCADVLASTFEVVGLDMVLPLRMLVRFFEKVLGDRVRRTDSACLKHVINKL